jgi:thioredoxin reductase (NADPH)
VIPRNWTTDLMNKPLAQIYDVIIVGAGPAGLCAAMYAGRGMLKAVTIERGAPGGELLNTDLVEDYPGFESIKGWELAQKMAEHAKKFGAEIVTDTIERIHKDADGWFDVETARGNTYRSQAVILTAGGTPTKLGIPGEKEYAGKGVSYCAVCDGAFFKGERLAVVGGGDAAVEEADYLTRYASKVHLVHRRDEFRASQIIQDRAFANPKIEVIRSTVVPEIVGNGRGVTHAVLENTTTGERSNLDVGGVFIFVGFKPNTQLVEGHVDHDAGGYFITDNRMMTSMAGLFAAGDVRSQLTRQITTAVGDATTAAIAVEKYLKSLREGP